MRKDWFGQFSEIEYQSDGQNDYFDEEMGLLARQDYFLRGSVLSSAWSRGKKKSDDPEKVVLDLIRIRNSVAGLLKVHGVPKGTRIEIAALGQIGKGAASFESIPSNVSGDFKRPYIMLDAEIYKNCDSREVLDIYCGIGVHEASHLNHTRQMFVDLKNGHLSGESAIWHGIFEDERIEELARNESPGYAGYLQAVKRALFEKTEFGMALSKWDNLPDMDKIRGLAFGFIRCPHLLKDNQKQWRTIAGKCVFEDLRALFPWIPKTENEVKAFGQLLIGYFEDAQTEFNETVANSTPEQIAENLNQQEQPEQQQSEQAEGEPQAGEGQEGEGSPEGGQQGREGSEAGEQSEGDSQSPQEPQEGGEQSGEQGQPGDGSEGQEGEQSGEQSDEQQDSQAGKGPQEDEGSEAKTEPEAREQGDTEPQSGDKAGEPKAESKTEANSNENRITGDHITERMQKQAAADFEDSKVSKAEKELADHLKNVASTLDDMKNAKDAADVIRKGGGNEEKVRKAEKKLEKLQKELKNELDSRVGRRFGTRELIEMIKRIDTVSKALSADETFKLAEAAEERLELGPEWEPHREGADVRRNVIIHPSPNQRTREKYKNYLKAVQGQVARMRNVFRLRLGIRKYNETERKSGRLHPRRISRAQSTSRIFKRSYTKTDMGVAICLLLDESGSMSRAHMQPSHSKASMALQVAVCMAEALRTTPGVEFEVYSFTSCGTGNDNFMKYLYGKKNPDLAAMGHYGRGSVNYDYMALEQAGRMFIENTSDRAQRIMIVLSDGAPCGEGRNGETAEQATKRASTALEKLGIKVIQVAIEDFRSMNCYKHVLKFTDIPNLINKMRGLITRIIKQASEVAQ